MRKQPPSREPKGRILALCGAEYPVSVGFNGVPPLSQEAVSEQSRTGRAQRNLNLGGNTDIVVRPKLVAIYQFRAFCVGGELRNF